MLLGTDVSLNTDTLGYLEFVELLMMLRFVK